MKQFSLTELDDQLGLLTEEQRAEIDWRLIPVLARILLRLHPSSR